MEMKAVSISDVDGANNAANIFQFIRNVYNVDCVRKLPGMVFFDIYIRQSGV